MSRLTWLLLALLGLLAATGAPGRSAAAPARPNVLLILADDLGYECLSGHGSADYRTPNLDRLAAEGARFTHCYTPPLCTPTRVQLLTGRYNARNYLRFGTLPRAERTLGHMLRQAGYATAVAGKWQLDEQGGQTAREAGFGEFCLWNYREEGLAAAGDRYADPNLIYLDRPTGKPVFRRFEGEYGPDVCRRYLTEFITRSARAKQPFLAYYPMLVTHDPFQPTPASAGWSAGDRHQRAPRFFKDMVEYMDREVGALLRTLEEVGARENTLVIFTSDNGTLPAITSTMRDGRTVVGGKGRLTDAGTHVPLIARWPGVIPAGQVREALVDSTDFLPTLAEAAGAPPPTPLAGGIDGRSFLPQARGEAVPGREWVLVDFRAGKPGSERNEGRFARDRRWKLYGGEDGPPRYRSGSLFDMERDPEERAPVPSGSPEADAARARLQRVLALVPPQP